jgi:hypothetical protein
MLIVQIITIALMILTTYLFYRSLGGRRQTLLYTKEDKEEWDNTIGNKLGDWFTLTNIVGTLTSIGTAYVFLIGSSKLFGYWTFICALTIWVGAFLTRAMTTRILGKSYVASLMQTKDQVAGVLASLFWRPEDSHAQSVARLVKYVSLANLAAVIWLDFSLFSDISTKILGFSSKWVGASLVFLTVLFIFHFTISYGLRGFVFADLFQSPAIVLASFVILCGCIWAGTQTTNITPSILTAPIVPLSTCIVFAIHATCLNMIQVVVTEPHWLRVWMFREKTISLQNVSLAATALLWVLLITTGFFVFLLSSGKIGEEGIATALTVLTQWSPIFSVAFWVAGVGALFASADTLIYCFLLVGSFDHQTGKLKTRFMSDFNPIAYSFLAGICFTVVYLLVKFLQLAFEKVLFILVPFCLNLFPAFILLVFGKSIRTRYIYSSMVGYVICAIIGFTKPEQELIWTLAASFIPVVVAIVALGLEKKIVTPEVKEALIK